VNGKVTQVAYATARTVPELFGKATQDTEAIVSDVPLDPKPLEDGFMRGGRLPGQARQSRPQRIDAPTREDTCNTQLRFASLRFASLHSAPLTLRSSPH
jgi:hypothetical protein